MRLVLNIHQLSGVHKPQWRSPMHRSPMGTNPSCFFVLFFFFAGPHVPFGCYHKCLSHLCSLGCLSRHSALCLEAFVSTPQFPCVKPFFFFFLPLSFHRHAFLPEADFSSWSPAFLHSLHVAPPPIKQSSIKDRWGRNVRCSAGKYNLPKVPRSACSQARAFFLLKFWVVYF